MITGTSLRPGLRVNMAFSSTNFLFGFLPAVIVCYYGHQLFAARRLRNTILYGAMPDVKHAVRDNSYLSLPLEEYQSEID